jgi:hypothetical protein
MCAIARPRQPKGVTRSQVPPYYIASYTPTIAGGQKNQLHRSPSALIDEIDFSQFAIDQNQGILETRTASWTGVRTA